MCSTYAQIESGHANCFPMYVMVGKFAVHDVAKRYERRNKRAVACMRRFRETLARSQALSFTVNGFTKQTKPHAVNIIETWSYLSVISRRNIYAPQIFWLNNSCSRILTDTQYLPGLLTKICFNLPRLSVFACHLLGYGTSEFRLNLHSPTIKIWYT